MATIVKGMSVGMKTISLMASDMADSTSSKAKKSKEKVLERKQTISASASAKAQAASAAAAAAKEAAATKASSAKMMAKQSAASVSDASAIKVLSPSIWSRLKRKQYAKVGRVVSALLAAGFDKSICDVVVKATFVTQSDADMAKCFEALCARVTAGFPMLGTDDLRSIIPLVGEEIDDGKMEELFKELDQDGSGYVELDEFKELLKACNPLDEDDSTPGRFSSFLKKMDSGVTAVKSKASLKSFDDALQTVKVIDPATQLKLKKYQMAKIGRVVKRMKKDDFSDEEINAYVKAVFVTREKEDFEPVFNMFPLNEGTLALSDFKKTLALVGEDVPEDTVESLFNEVDADGNGTLDLDEFVTLLLGLNPVTESEGSKFKSYAPNVKGFMASFDDTMQTLKVIDRATKKKLKPFQMAKIGRVVKQMKAGGFDDAAINQFVKAVFVTRADEDFDAVWELFPTDEGKLALEDFKQVLVVIGEDVPIEKVESLFAEVDEDGSGSIEVEEFKELLKKLNPTEQEKSAYSSYAGADVTEDVEDILATYQEEAAQAVAEDKEGDAPLDVEQEVGAYG